MLIACIRCKEKFQQKRYERTCSNHKKPDEDKREILKHYRIMFGDWYNYIFGIRRTFQDPYYQFIRLHNTEFMQRFSMHYTEDDIANVFNQIKKENMEKSGIIIQ